MGWQGVLTFFAHKKWSIYRIFTILDLMMSKSAQFETAEQEVAEVAKALSHPARLAILKFLAGLEGCMCGDIVDELPLAQSTVSQHLKYLKEAGLIKGEISGLKSSYCLNTDALREFKSNLDALFGEIDARIERGRCC